MLILGPRSGELNIELSGSYFQDFSRDYSPFSLSHLLKVVGRLAYNKTQVKQDWGCDYIYLTVTRLLSLNRSHFESDTARSVPAVYCEGGKLYLLFL